MQSISWIFGQIFNLDKGFFYTTGLMAYRPERVIQDYLKMATVKYMHPFRFLFVWVSISVILTHSLGFFENLADFIGQDMNANKSEVELMVFNKYMEFISNYLSVFTMGQVPFLAIASFLTHRKFKENLVERLIIHSFIFGGIIALSIPLYTLVLLPGIGNSWMYFFNFLTLFYIAWVYKRHYQQSIILSGFKALFTYCVSLFFLMIIVFTILGISIATQKLN